MKTIIKTVDAPNPVGPYNQAILSGNTLYISGQIAIDQIAGKLITGDAREQTIRVMKNLEAILKAAGMDFSNVVKASIFLSDMENFQKVNEVYATYFSETPPARECIQAARFPRSVDIEISVIAVKE